MMIRQETKVVHLDQKNWIELARGYYGLESDFREIAHKVVEKSASAQAIFPLSIIHFDETVRKMNSEKRQRLAKFMILVSQGWSILPAPMIIEPEIMNACLKYLGRPKGDLQKFAIKKGISQLVGAKADLDFEVKDKNNLLSQNMNLEHLKKYLLEKVESTDTMLMLMEHGIDQSELKELQEKALVSTDELEEIRLLDEKQFKDNDLRRRVNIVKYFLKVINPKVIKFLLSIGEDPEIFSKKVYKNRNEIICFFQSMPTSYSLIQLTLYRDMQKERKIQPNDLNDIMSLSIAIPYSDVVVTETMWQTAIIQTKLDELRPTKVLRSAKELKPILN